MHAWRHAYYLLYLCVALAELIEIDRRMMYGRFYAAETVLALEYLHMMGVVYRDLKPENVLVRADGHIMLSDFDLSLKCDDVVPKLLRQPRGDSDGANPSLTHGHSSSCVPPIQPVLSCLFNGVTRKRQVPMPDAAAVDADADEHSEPEQTSDPAEVVVEPVAARSRSFVGTHEYLAPEVISGQGHGSAVDWWTLGVFMYEMVYGQTPFKGATNEETLANIVSKRPVAFPRVPASASCGEREELLRAQDLMARLLAKCPGKRLGSCTGSGEVKRHAFFRGVNWALVRSVRPPEVPVPAAPVARSKAKTMSRKERREPYKQQHEDHFDYF
uniref:non-specific serine/threonine protein kinase n=1 Tax=Aegilops tauschii subsp. strangulata TaxID=200361 RepID=A0A453EB38_AEGTS